jgi:hypothetical protein
VPAGPLSIYFLDVQRSGLFFNIFPFKSRSAKLSLNLSRPTVLAFSCTGGAPHTLLPFVWTFGVCSGGYHYSLKMFLFRKVRARNFARAWGFLQAAQVGLTRNVLLSFIAKTQSFATFRLIFVLFFCSFPEIGPLAVSLRKIIFMIFAFETIIPHFCENVTTCLT